MADIQKLMSLMVDLKEVEAELKCAMDAGCPKDKVEYAAQKLRDIIQPIEAEYWQLIEKLR